MARLREEIALIENAVAGQRCIIRPAVGRTWLEQHIEHGGLTLSQMTNIKILLVSPTRTVILQEFKDGAELDAINKRYGRHTEAGTLSVYYRRPEMQSEVERMAFALGTGGLQMMRIEFDIAAATTPAVKAWGKKTANRHVSAGMLSYIVAHNSGGNAEGENHYDSIDRRDRIGAIHAFNNKIDKAELRVDDTTAYSLTRARSDFDQKGADTARVPYAAGVGFCVDFLLSGVMDESLVMADPAGNYQVQQMRLTTTLGVSPNTTIRYLTEYLSTWASLNGAGA